MVKLLPRNRHMKYFRCNFVKLLSLIVVAAISVSAIQAHAADGTLYKASKVYTMAGDPLSPGQVLVVDGKIKAVGETIDLAGAAVETVDLGEGSVLMPGLIDAYSQTGLATSGQNEVSDEVTPNFKAAHAVDWNSSALRRQRDAGTTTMCVCPGTQNVLSGIAALIKTGESGANIINEDGPLLASMCSDPARGNRARSRPDSIFVRQPTNRMGVVWIMRSTFDKANRSSESDHPLAIVKNSLAGKRPMMFVCRISHDLTSVASLADEFGFDPILVGGQEAYKVKEMLVERDYPVILQRQRYDTVRGAEGAELLWNQPGVLAAAGITFALSGDDLLEQARFAHRNGLDQDMALAAVTTTPAKLLGIDGQVGAIKVGYDADLVALDGEPLEMTTSIRQVIVDGDSGNQEKEQK